MPFSPHNIHLFDIDNLKLLQIHKHADLTLTLSSTPTLHDIDIFYVGEKEIRIIRSVASKWKEVATRLYFEPNHIALIEKNHPHDCESACREVFSEWILGHGRKPISWITLLKALNESEFSEMARELETFLSQ